MKRAFAIVAILALLALGGQAFAEQCTVDAVPAATLLLPFFQVDFTAPVQDAINTIFTINNASAAPALAHVTLWTNLSIPTVDFDVYLTGYDVQVVDLGSIFRTGTLPVTATDRQDTATDSISPHGGSHSDNPVWDDVLANPPNNHTNTINEASCDNFFPFTNPALGPTLVSRIQNGHTGQPISGNTCLGFPDGLESNGALLATGYVTIDSVTSCSVVFPGGTGYFVNGGQGIANNRNLLWGDYFTIDPANAAAFGDPLVHVEAFDPVGGVPGEADVPDQGTAFDFTFYSRYTRASGFSDNREPLANVFATRYITGGAFSGGTKLYVWRDSQQTATAVTCGTTYFDLNPDSEPFLEEGEVIAFNESEDAVRLCEGSGQVSPPQADVTCFPLETNCVQVGVDPLNPPFNNGWLFLNLDLADVFTNVDTFRSQAWVTPVFTALGLYEAGYSAIQLHSTCDGLGGTIFGTVQ
jgi:hypothetical protein